MNKPTQTDLLTDTTPAITEASGIKQCPRCSQGIPPNLLGCPHCAEEESVIQRKLLVDQFKIRAVIGFLEDRNSLWVVESKEKLDDGSTIKISHIAPYDRNTQTLCDQPVPSNYRKALMMRLQRFQEKRPNLCSTCLQVFDQILKSDGRNRMRCG